MLLDAEHCYQVIRARDARFDGIFYVGVSTTGIYCRPVCTVRTPGRDRCTFYSDTATAEAAGYRPCLRCRPELAPGKAPIDSVKRTADAAVLRIDAGALTNRSVDELARDFGITARHLHRVIETEYGVSPLALAQTRRLLLAKQLLTDTSLKVVDIAFASGFSSVRQFNRRFKQSYRLNPLALRKRRPLEPHEGIAVKLGFRSPLAWQVLIEFLANRAPASTEQVIGKKYVRTVRIGKQAGWIAAEPAGHDILRIEMAPSLLPVLPDLQSRLRRLFDLNANPAVIDQHLSSHKKFHGLVAKTPGLRVPGALCGFELALRAVLGQQISVQAATTIFGRFVATFGSEVSTPFESLHRTAPTAGDVANASLQQLIDRGLTRKRAATVSALAHAAADGTLQLDPLSNFATTRHMLQEIPGIGLWTAEYVAMRALGDPDAFPHSDLGLLNALRIDSAAKLQSLAERWRPWRAYAAIHLWHTLSQRA